MPRLRRYAVVVEDRQSGILRRFATDLRPFVLGLVSVLALPVLVGLGLKWSARAEISALHAERDRLEVENRSFRQATTALTDQIQTLQRSVDDIASRSSVDPATRRAMDRLPAAVRSRAVGGASPTDLSGPFDSAQFGAPDDTFGAIRDALLDLEARLRTVQNDAERRRRLADSTPSIWPVAGWLSDAFGQRSDPFTGRSEFHNGLDISADRGQAVFATAGGTIRAAERSGAFGNMVVVDHGFGLSTRYAHLSSFAVAPGQRVARGDTVGHVGRTGRATGDHVHYEVLLHGKPLNPLRFLLDRP